VGKMIKIKSGTGQIGAYLAEPKDKPKACLVVVQEWWGLNDWVKGVADRFAGQGYLTIAPDLYHGKVAKDPELAHELMRGLPEERAIQDIQAAADFIRPSSTGKGLQCGVIGFCMGGGLALRSNLDHGPFTATVVCYGAPVTSVDRLRTLSGQVLGIYGAEDRGIGPDQTRPFEAALRQSGHLGGFRVYEGAGHAFLNDTGDAYRPDQAKAAWEKIDAFLQRWLTQT